MKILFIILFFVVVYFVLWTLLRAAKKADLDTYEYMDKLTRGRGGK